VKTPSSSNWRRRRDARCCVAAGNSARAGAGREPRCIDGNYALAGSCVACGRPCRGTRSHRRRRQSVTNSQFRSFGMPQVRAQYAAVRLIPLIGPTTNLFPVTLNTISNATLRENARQLPIEPPNDRWPLGFIASQPFILRPLDRSNGLVLC
jgi:hypothetical protein